VTKRIRFPYLFRNTPPADPKAPPHVTPHVDQNVEENPSGDWEIYQGVVYLTESSETTSTTVLWPKSHCLYDEFMANRGASGHFVPLGKPSYVKNFSAHARRVAVPAGVMLPWNSRTVHDGWNNGPRLALPVCFEPSVRRAVHTQREKLVFVKEGSPSTHWASLGIAHDCYNDTIGVRGAESGERVEGHQGSRTSGLRSHWRTPEHSGPLGKGGDSDLCDLHVRHRLRDGQGGQTCSCPSVLDRGWGISSRAVRKKENWRPPHSRSGDITAMFNCA